MTKYAILTAIGLAIDIITYGTHYFITSVPDVILSVASIVGAIFMLLGLYFYRREKKNSK